MKFAQFLQYNYTVFLVESILAASQFIAILGEVVEDYCLYGFSSGVETSENMWID